MSNLHNKIVSYMANLDFVEKYLIAQVEEDGNIFDCIYCTILRNAVLFTIVGLIIGFILGFILGN